MGFQSPSSGHAEKLITTHDFVVMNPASTKIFDVGDRIFLIDRSIKLKSSNKIAFNVFGELQIGKLMGKSIITLGGEAHERSVLGEVELLGIVMVQILRVNEPDRPTI